jgi:hypothetical protein
MKRMMLILALTGLTAVGSYGQNKTECVCRMKGAHKSTSAHKVVTKHKAVTNENIAASKQQKLVIPATVAVARSAKNDDAAARCPIELTIADEREFMGNYPSLPVTDNKRPQRESDRHYKRFPVYQPVSDVPSTDPDYYLKLGDDGLCRFHCSLPY